MIFLRRWRIRRILERKLQDAHDEYQFVLHNPEKTRQALFIATIDLQHAQWALDRHKSSLIISKAERIALDIPSHQEKPSWWRNDGDEYEPAVLHWLSEKGRQGVANLIRDERRKTWECRIKVLTPILAILASVLGLTIALITLFIKVSESRLK